MKIRKNMKLRITCDYDWKYGEPSIYPDERLWYLIFTLNGTLIDDPDVEFRILDRIGRSYKGTLIEVKQKGEINITL